MNSALSAITWNARAATQGPGGELSIERGAAAVAGHDPDLIAWQELEFLPDGSLAPRSARLVRSQGLDHFTGLPTSPSHFDGGHRLGVGISSRYKMGEIGCRTFTNPKLHVDWPKRRMYSHDKGILWATIESPLGPLKFAAVHYIPFHMFAKEADDPTCSAMWLETSNILQRWQGPALVGGDYNTNNRGILLKQLPGWQSATNGINSRPGQGRAFDDFVISNNVRCCEVVVIPNFSDHHAVLTRFTIE